MVKASIDVGSNSVLLLVEERRAESWKPLIERTAITSLGEGVKQTGVLSEESMKRTLEALADFFAIAREAGAAEIEAGATMAARIASNTQTFLDRARAQGTPVFVLSGTDEAELGFRAVVSDPVFAGESLISIVDVGGQSTEIATAERRGTEWHTVIRKSFPIGTLALLGSTLKEERPEPKALLAACLEIDAAIGLDYSGGQAGVAVALGATGTNLVSIREKLAKWSPELVHGALLTYEEISKASASLFGLTVHERSRLTGIEPGREATLPVGALILERCLYALRAEECRVSVRGWRHALLEEGLPRLSSAKVAE